jgi:curved DNA-binding protein CbpA
VQGNLYDLLGVRPDDDAELLRKAFVKAAKECHPDHHGGDPAAAARFRQIAEAYDVLRDAERRAGYDRLLEAEREPPLCPDMNAALSGVRRQIFAGALIGAMLVAALAGGHELFSRVSKTAVEESPGTASNDSAEIVANQPAEQSAAVERSRTVGASAQMPIVVPVENPVAPAEAAPARQTIESARDGGGSVVPADHVLRSPFSQVPAAETSGASGLSASDAASLANKPGGGTPEPGDAGPALVNQPAESAETEVFARIHAAMTRPSASRTPFRHVSPAHRHSLARMHAPYCDSDTPPPWSSGNQRGGSLPPPETAAQMEAH